MPGDPEIYPMPMFTTLSVADVPVSVDWYANKLGFSTVFLLPVSDGGIAIAHLRWRKYADLLLLPEFRPRDATYTRGVGVTLSFLVDTASVDELAAEFAARGVQITEGPVTRPWNTRDILVHDPDGYALVFFEPVDTAKSFEDVMGDVSGTDR